MPMSLAAIGPRTVITFPERKCVSDRSVMLHHPSWLAHRRSKLGKHARVQPNRHEDDQTGNDLREEWGDVRQYEAIADHRDGQRPQHRSDNRSLAAHERGAAKNHGSNHFQLKSNCCIGGSRAEPRRNDNSRHRGCHAAQDVNHDETLLDRDTRPSRGFHIGAYGNHMPSKLHQI